MANVTMSLEGFEALQDAIKRAPDLVKSMSADAVQASSFATAQRARAHVSVRTGELKSRIEPSRVNIRKNGSILGGIGLTGGTSDKSTPPTIYWRFLEFGTKYMSARPFFRPAADEEDSHFVQRMRAIGQRLERDFSTGRFT